MAYTVVIGEKVNTGGRSLLIAPEFERIIIGDTVSTGSKTYKVMYVNDYVREDQEILTALRSALGSPVKITSIIHEDAVKWEEEDVGK